MAINRRIHTYYATSYFIPLSIWVSPRVHYDKMKIYISYDRNISIYVFNVSVMIDYMGQN